MALLTARQTPFSGPLLSPRSRLAARPKRCVQVQASADAALPKDVTSRREAMLAAGALAAPLGLIAAGAVSAPALAFVGGKNTAKVGIPLNVKDVKPGGNFVISAFRYEVPDANDAAFEKLVVDLKEKAKDPKNIPGLINITLFQDAKPRNPSVYFSAAFWISEQAGENFILKNPIGQKFVQDVKALDVDFQFDGAIVKA